MRRVAYFFLILLFLTLVTKVSYNTEFIGWTTSAMTPEEQQIIALINGSEAYNYDLELESIAQKRFAYRCGGTVGAQEAASWLKAQLEGFNISTRLEPFNFTTWNLTVKPSLLIDEDSNLNTTNDQTQLETFGSSWQSWPTPENGTFSDLVVLPLPEAPDKNAFDQISGHPEWPSIDGKIALIGLETYLKWNWVEEINLIMMFQKPAAIVYTWWYEWMAFTSPSILWAGGSSWGKQIPRGVADYTDGLLIRQRENTSDVSALMKINSVISTETHYNIVGEVTGYLEPEKKVIVSCHYDTITCSGFCDNGAGTAGVLEIAKAVSQSIEAGVYRPKYTLLFIMFTSEEYYLVGSANYVMQHKNDMPNIVSVINLDCIGSDDLYATQTEASTDLNLNQIILDAAQDLNLTITLESPTASDHETFRDPASIEDILRAIWQFESNISDATPVKASTMIFSQPLYPSDKWSMGSPGYIHTSYDNSTSTTTLNWVETDDLEDHIKLATLVTIRDSPNVPTGDIDHNGVVDMRDIGLVCRAFGSKIGDDNWNCLCDMNVDGTVDMRDIGIVCSNFGKHCLSAQELLRLHSFQKIPANRVGRTSPSQ